MEPKWPPVTVLVILCALTIARRSSAIEFIQEPEDQNITVEYESNLLDLLLLECEVSSVELDQKISWYKNGVIISDNFNLRSNISDIVDSERYILLSYGTGIGVKLLALHVSVQTVEMDRGHYQCAVTSLDDVIVDNGASQIAEVAIYATPRPEFPRCSISNPTGEIEMTNPVTVVMAGDSYTLRCLSDPGMPPVSLLWNSDADGESERLSTSSSGQNADELYFIDYDWYVIPMDTVTVDFTCTLQHPTLSSDQRCTLGPFDIHYLPIVRIEPSHIDVTSGTDEALFTCNINANPQVTQMSWFVNGTSATNDSRFEIVGPTLKFLNVSNWKDGEYTVMCTVINSVGLGRGSATLKKSPTIRVSGRQGDKGNVGLIAGVVVGCVILFAVVIVLIVVLIYVIKCRRTQPKFSDEAKEKDIPLETSRDGNHGFNGGENAVSAYASVNVAFQNESRNTVSTASIELELKLQQPHGEGNNKLSSEEDETKEIPIYAKPFKKKAIAGTDDGNNVADSPGKPIDGRTEDNGKTQYENIADNIAKTKERIYDEVCEDKDGQNQGRDDLKTNDISQKNIEGLTYADLDLSSSNERSRPNTDQAMKKDDAVIYAEINV